MPKEKPGDRRWRKNLMRLPQVSDSERFRILRCEVWRRARRFDGELASAVVEIAVIYGMEWEIAREVTVAVRRILLGPDERTCSIASSGKSAHPDTIMKIECNYGYEMKR